MRLRFLAALAAFLAAAASAAPRTVCTVTVNSADERDVLQRFLPAEGDRFVELVKPGQPDWLAAACRAQVKCDVLVVSGHFAGVEFYSSRPTMNETLKVDDIERAQCTNSCPGVFESLKEVYLFGCDTLKPEPVRSATPQLLRDLLAQGATPVEAERLARDASLRHAESSRDMVRRLFPNVPVIYGFASLAPLGRHAGPMLQRHFETQGVAGFGSGVPSAPLLSLFGPSSMVATSGESDPAVLAAHRANVCRFQDDRDGEDARIAALHRLLAGPAAELRMQFDRLERFFSNHPAGGDAARARLAADDAAAGRYLTLARATQDPALRLRMIALGRTVGWLDATAEKGEQLRLAVDVIRDRAADYGEVDLVCRLHAPGVGTVPAGLAAMTAAQAAALACLGDARARSRMLKALASADEHEVRAAQAYLRHRPITEPAELRSVAADVARMKNAAAQARALDVLGRHHIADREVLDALKRLGDTTRSAEVRRAVAEVFLRAGIAPAP